MKRQVTPDNATGENPEMLREMIAATEEFLPSSDGDGSEIGAMRILYAKEGDPMGAGDVSNDAASTLLMDKLGERLAFERVGTRLYDALLTKLDAYGTYEGGPERSDLEHIMEEELQHFEMLRQSIEALGGDPLQLTPSANLQLNASKGVGHVLVDPRVTLIQSLEAILLAELADNECWESLAELAMQAGEGELSARCEEALEAEEEHLDKVRNWLAAAQGRSGTVEVEVKLEGLDRDSERGRGAASKSRKARPSKKR